MSATPVPKPKHLACRSGQEAPSPTYCTLRVLQSCCNTARPNFIPLVPVLYRSSPLHYRSSRSTDVSSSRPIVEREWNLFSDEGQKVNDLVQVAPHAAAK